MEEGDEGAASQTATLEQEGARTQSETPDQMQQEVIVILTDSESEEHEEEDEEEEEQVENLREAL